MFAPKKVPHLTSLHPDRFKKLSPCTTQYTSMPLCSCTSVPVCQYASMLSPRPFSPALCVGSCAVWTQQQSSSQRAVKQSLASGCKGRRGRSCDGITVMEHVGKGSWSVGDSFLWVEAWLVLHAAQCWRHGKDWWDDCDTDMVNRQMINLEKRLGTEKPDNELGSCDRASLLSCWRQHWQRRRWPEIMAVVVLLMKMSWVTALMTPMTLGINGIEYWWKWHWVFHAVILIDVPIHERSAVFNKSSAMSLNAVFPMSTDQFHCINKSYIWRCW